jgi:hypothetical protein
VRLPTDTVEILLERGRIREFPERSPLESRDANFGGGAQGRKPGRIFGFAPFYQSQALANDFTGVLVAPRPDQRLDQAGLFIGQHDIARGHDASLQSPLANYANVPNARAHNPATTSRPLFIDLEHGALNGAELKVFLVAMLSRLSAAGIREGDTNLASLRGLGVHKIEQINALLRDIDTTMSRWRSTWLISVRQSAISTSARWG